MIHHTQALALTVVAAVVTAGCTASAAPSSPHTAATAPEAPAPTFTPLTSTSTQNTVVQRGYASGARALGDWDLRFNSHYPGARMTVRGVVESVKSKYVENMVYSTLTIRVEKGWRVKGGPTPATVTATRQGGTVPMSELLPELTAKGEAKNLSSEQLNGNYEENFFGAPNSHPGDHIVVSLIDAGEFGKKMDAQYSIVGSAQGIFWIEGDELVQKGEDLTPKMKKHAKVAEIDAITADA